MLEVTPVGVVVGGRDRPFDDDWDEVEAIIRLDGTQFGPEALAGLDEFSHVEVVYLFHLVDPDKVERGARRPRGREDWPLVGIFAQRGKNRPNRIGVSRCPIVRVSGLDVHVRGLDAVDGTPVLDVKPHMAEFDARGSVHQPGWSKELMAGYRGDGPAAD
jgi:tRNA-Thr(GGU) m(6)t(6)A37 methyltransferase TsaA